METTNTTDTKTSLINQYTIKVGEMLIEVRIIYKEEEPVPIYAVSIANISDATKIVLEKVRQEFVSKVDWEQLERFEREKIDIKEEFQEEIAKLIRKYFPDVDKRTQDLLVNYLLEENLGLGKLDILLKDPELEEIVVNNHKEPVWVYHRYYGWLKTNIRIMTEARIRHYAMMIGRHVGKEITLLNPLMDAHLSTGDRVNSTLYPISTKGNTLTIRKFATDPWTITKFIKIGTINYESAALIWLAVQNELSMLITGGTGSGKTSMLNVISNFLPPNQRVISIEDTRELILPNNLHWVPMETRLPNPEGKGGITMLDLLVNSLRMRPDRIIVGEIRRKPEAEVLLEAMHTGHSVYATLHANNADETVIRLTNPPIGIPKPMISAVTLIVVQNRNRRTGKRRTFQIAEVLPNGDPKVLMQLNVRKDILEEIAPSEIMTKRLKLYTGMTTEQIKQDLIEKIKILKWMVSSNIEYVNTIGQVMSKYYLGKLRI